MFAPGSLVAKVPSCCSRRNSGVARIAQVGSCGRLNASRDLVRIAPSPELGRSRGRRQSPTYRRSRPGSTANRAARTLVGPRAASLDLWRSHNLGHLRTVVSEKAPGRQLPPPHARPTGPDPSGTRLPFGNHCPRICCGASGKLGRPWWIQSAHRITGASPQSPPLEMCDPSRRQREGSTACGIRLRRYD